MCRSYNTLPLPIHSLSLCLSLCLSVCLCLTPAPTCPCSQLQYPVHPLHTHTHTHIPSHAHTYLPFARSYNAVNGIPSCANSFLLNETLRTSWGFQGYVTSDSGAIEDITQTHHYAKDMTEVRLHVCICVNVCVKS